MGSKQLRVKKKDYGRVPLNWAVRLMGPRGITVLLLKEDDGYYLMEVGQIFKNE